MGYTIEIARIDYSSGRLRAHEKDRKKLLHLDHDDTGVFESLDGEKIGVDICNGMVRLDLTLVRTLRDNITGKKGDRRFIRYLGGSSQQLNGKLLLLVRPDQRI